MVENGEHRPIRVCFETMRAYPLFNPAVESVFGGAEVDLYFLATELARDRDFGVSFIVGDYGQEAVEVRQGVRLIKSVDVGRSFLLGGRRLWRALRDADADIYIRKGVSLGTVLEALFCRVHKRRFVCRTSNSGECDGTYLRQHLLRGKACAWALHAAAMVFVQNDDDAVNLAKAVGVDGRVVRNGHRLGEEASGQDRDSVLWVGRSAAVKGPQRFLELARRFPEQSFTMICQKNADDDNYDVLVERAGGIDNLEVIGSVQFDQINDYFQRAKVLVNTSDAEGFPNTFIQACKAQTPILSFAVDPDSLFSRYNCGLCARGDEGNLLDMLKKLLDPVVAAKCGDNGRRYVEEHHDIVRIVEEYKRVFRELIS